MAEPVPEVLKKVDLGEEEDDEEAEVRTEPEPAPAPEANGHPVKARKKTVKSSQAKPLRRHKKRVPAKAVQMPPVAVRHRNMALDPTGGTLSSEEKRLYNLKMVIKAARARRLLERSGVPFMRKGVSQLMANGIVAVGYALVRQASIVARGNRRKTLVTADLQHVFPLATGKRLYL